MANYRLRPATNEDYDFLHHVVAHTMRPYIEQTWGPFDENLSRQFFRETFTLEDYFVIMVGDEPAGGLLLKRSPERLFISRIQILPEFQNQGIGTAIIRALIHEAQEAGQPLELRVLKTNPAAQRLYERLWFIVVDEIETHYLMRRTCDQPGSESSSS